MSNFNSLQRAYDSMIPDYDDEDFELDEAVEAVAQAQSEVDTAERLYDAGEIDDEAMEAAYANLEEAENELAAIVRKREEDAAYDPYDGMTRWEWENL